MAHQRAHIVLPEGLLREIDALVGHRKRSAFLAEVAEREVRRRRLLKVLSEDAPAWNPADHPEIEEAGGSAAWVKNLRREWERSSSRPKRPKQR